MTDEGWAWAAIVASGLLVGGYEAQLARTGRRNPTATARSAHRMMRGAWVEALSTQPGSELLAVQALRNSLMSATINASTAALALMGSVSLMASRGARTLSPRLAIELALAALLFAAYVCSAFAMRYYHHAGYAMSLPVDSPERRARTALATMYVQSGGTLYSWSLRCFLFVAPLVAAMLDPLLTPIAAAALVFVLSRFDRAPMNV